MVNGQTEAGLNTNCSDVPVSPHLCESISKSRTNMAVAYFISVKANVFPTQMRNLVLVIKTVQDKFDKLYLTLHRKE